MKKKQHDLLKYLLSQSKPITSTEIANALSISTRSVKNYVSDINSLYNTKLILSSRNGYELNRQASSLLTLDNSESIPQTGEERAFFIIKELILYHTSHLDLFELCENLCISYSTVKAVISKMNKAFSTYGVEFLCENDCLYIKGEEKNKRKLISYVLSEESKNCFITLQQLKQCFPDLDIDQLHNTEQENALLQQLIAELDSLFGISLNSYERYEIYMLIKANANYSIVDSKAELKSLVGNEVISLTEYYIRQINTLYLIDLSDESFVTPFSLHLKNLLFRLRNGQNIANPLTKSIKLNSPVVFDMAIYITLDIMERYHFYVSEDETAFLAMHIGAEIERQTINRSKIPTVLLCPEYRNLGVDLLNKLLLNFGNQINIVSSVHSEEALQSLDISSFGLLFTTVPLYHTYDCDTIQISPFNLSQQYSVIQETIVNSQNRYKNHKLKTNFHAFFEKDLFVANTNMTSKNQILTYLCDLLQVKCYTDAGFEEKVYKRENASTTAFGHIAIPHSTDMDAIKTSIAVAVSKKGFQWDNNTVHLVFLLAINKADKKTFRELYESLISLFSNDSILQEARSCTTFEEFETLVYSNINQE